MAQKKTRKTKVPSQTPKHTQAIKQTQPEPAQTKTKKEDDKAEEDSETAHEEHEENETKEEEEKEMKKHYLLIFLIALFLIKLSAQVMFGNGAGIKKVIIQPVIR